MKKTINFYEFEQEFIGYNRGNNFSYAGKKALFDYLEDLESDTGKEIELDVIALCCEYTEYADVQEFAAQHSTDYLVWDIEPEEADEEEGTEAVEGAINYEATLDNIRGYTTVIDIDGESFITQNF